MASRRARRALWTLAGFALGAAMIVAGLLLYLVTRWWLLLVLLFALAYAQGH